MAKKTEEPGNNKNNEQEQQEEEQEAEQEEQSPKPEKPDEDLSSEEPKSYEISVYNSPVRIEIKRMDDFVLSYIVSFPEISRPTEVVLETIKDEILRDARINPQDIFDAEAIKKLSTDFTKKAQNIMSKRLPQLVGSKKNMLICHLLCAMIGLRPLESPLSDRDLEDVVVNTSTEPVEV